MDPPLIIYKWFSLALDYSVDIYTHEHSSLFHHRVYVDFNASVMMF